MKCFIEEKKLKILGILVVYNIILDLKKNVIGCKEKIIMIFGKIKILF